MNILEQVSLDMSFSLLMQMQTKLHPKHWNVARFLLGESWHLSLSLGGKPVRRRLWLQTKWWWRRNLGSPPRHFPCDQDPRRLAKINHVSACEQPVCVLTPRAGLETSTYEPRSPWSCRVERGGPFWASTWHSSWLSLTQVSSTSCTGGLFFAHLLLESQRLSPGLGGRELRLGCMFVCFFRGCILTCGKSHC